MPSKNLPNIYAEIEALLGKMQVGDVASNHKAEIAGFTGWNYIAVTAVARQATRSLVRVYDDSQDPKAKTIRKSMRLEYGAEWRKSFDREKAGVVLPAEHKLVQLLHEPNPYQSGASFRWEVVQQLRLHGACMIWNRPNKAYYGTKRTVQRYVVPIALCTPVPPSRGCPYGAMRVTPTNYWYGNPSMNIADGFAPIRRLGPIDIPIEKMTIIRYPHPMMRGDGASPTSAAAKWIDNSTLIDQTMLDFYQEGPNGRIIVSV